MSFKIFCQILSSKLSVLNWTHSFHWVRSGGTIWRHRSRSNLAQEMAWCLTAISQYRYQCWLTISTVYPKKYAHSFVVLCFVVVMLSFIMNSHEVFIHIHQGCFAGTGAIVRLPQCQWSKPDGYGKISQCITTTKHSKAKTVCIFLGIYCRVLWYSPEENNTGNVHNHRNAFENYTL